MSRTTTLWMLLSGAALAQQAEPPKVPTQAPPPEAPAPPPAEAPAPPPAEAPRIPSEGQPATAVEPAPPAIPTAPVDLPPAEAAPNNAPPRLPSGPLREVKVEGARRIDPFLFEYQVTRQIAIGSPLEAWKLSEVVRKIYDTGVVEDLRIDASQTSDGGVRLTLKVKEKPAIREVKLEGNKKLDEEALNEVIDLASFDVLSEADLRDNIQRMRDKYVEKGYYLVEIEPEVREVADGMVDVTFKITENRKVIVQRIDITGNESVADRKIRRYLQTKQGLPWGGKAGSFDEARLANDVQVVRSVFLEEGYIEAEVDAPRVYLSPDKRYIYITIHVTEGTRYKLGKIEVRGDFVEDEGLTREAVQEIIEGETAATLHDRWKRARKEVGEGQRLPPGWERGRRELLAFNPEHPPLVPGDWFKLTTMQAAMQEVTDLYGDQGYAFANVVPLTDTDKESQIVDITFDVQRGEKVKIGLIDISGNDPTFDKVVRREIPINEGDIYSGSAIKEARERLDRLGYFEKVEITTPRDPTQSDVLNMNVEVAEQPTGSFSVGAGFSNIENFMLNLNVSKNNFLGLGYIMSAAANVSRSRQQGNLQLYDPYFLDSRWTLRVDGYSIARQFIEDEYQRGGSLAVGRYLDRRDDIRLEWDYTFEDTGLSNLDAYKQRMLGGELYRNGQTSTGTMSLVVDKRNNRIQATRGVFATASVGLSGGWRSSEDEVTQVFGGDFNFYETKFNFRAFQPVVPKGEWLIFKYNGTIGRIASTDGSVVPYIHRYRAGGINSVRGYDWYSLGPSLRAIGYKESSRSMFVGSEDPTNADDRLVVGGTETWINNFELESPIVKAAGISTVLFFDAGNAFGDPWGVGHIDPTGLRMAYGFGVRWVSPMGPLRFEWGFPVNPREDERRAVFDFSIGSLF